MRRNRELFFGCVILLAASAAWMLVWSRMRSVSPEGDQVEYWRRQGLKVYARFEPVSTPEGIERIVASSEVEDREGALASLPSGTIDAVRSLASSFINARVSAESPEQYLAWLGENGYRFKGIEEFEANHGPLRFLSDLVGIEAPTLRELFVALWDNPLSRSATMSAICEGEGASLVTIGHARRHVRATQNPEGRLGRDIWVGKVSANCRFWMRPPVTRAEAIEKHGQVVTALVSVIAHVPGGDRRPFHVAMFLEPDSGRWWIDACAVTNHMGADDSWTCMEF